MPKNKKGEKTLHLYSDLADWFYLLTAPEGYLKEADFFRGAISDNSRIPVKTMLELGSGGGNNASHLKEHFRMTLTDLSENMLAISRRFNPECEHIQGDMRTLRLKRQFDAVFVHDAISYLTTEDDLFKAIETAFIHCQPGGVALFVPDYIRETFTPTTSHGGHDAGNRGLRYLSWTWDPDTTDTEYYVEMVYLLKNGNNFDVVAERHLLGVFKKETWFKLMKEIGFENVRAVDYPAGIHANAVIPVFYGVKPE
jgi:SAM-dependent methyltransferase